MEVHVREPDAKDNKDRNEVIFLKKRVHSTMQETTTAVRDNPERFVSRRQKAFP